MGTFEGSGEVAVAEKTLDPLTSKENYSRLLNFRAELIRNVLTSGLKSSERLSVEMRPYLGSNDPVLYGYETSTSISGNQIVLKKDHSKLGEQINNALYFSSTGSLAVVAERSDPQDFLNVPRRNYWGPITAEKKRILAKRMRSSFLVICDAKTANEVSGQGLITPDNFSHIIFPGEIWRDYLKTDPYAEVRFPNVLLANGYIEREVGVKPLKFNVPGYEAPIKKILKEVDQPIWIHAVRLPTEYDFEQAA